MMNDIKDGFNRVVHSEEITQEQLKSLLMQDVKPVKNDKALDTEQTEENKKKIQEKEQARIAKEILEVLKVFDDKVEDKLDNITKTPLNQGVLKS